jgi:hypothetical protein
VLTQRDLQRMLAAARVVDHGAASAARKAAEEQRAEQRAAAQVGGATHGDPKGHTPAATRRACAARAPSLMGPQGQQLAARAAGRQWLVPPPDQLQARGAASPLARWCCACRLAKHAC